MSSGGQLLARPRSPALSQFLLSFAEYFFNTLYFCSVQLQALNYYFGIIEEFYVLKLNSTSVGLVNLLRAITITICFLFSDYSFALKEGQLL